MNYLTVVEKIQGKNHVMSKIMLPLSLSLRQKLLESQSNLTQQLEEHEVATEHAESYLINDGNNFGLFSPF